MLIPSARMHLSIENLIERCSRGYCSCDGFFNADDVGHRRGSLWTCHALADMPACCVFGANCKRCSGRGSKVGKQGDACDVWRRASDARGWAVCASTTVRWNRRCRRAAGMQWVVINGRDHLCLVAFGWAVASSGMQCSNEVAWDSMGR
ncbi:hypothetical protein ACLOJK_034453 [Asimina triloba]